MFCPNCNTNNEDHLKFCVTCGSLLQNSDQTKSKDAEKAAVLPSGHVLDSRYEILGIIEKGGMGAVYRAMDNRLDNICAVKEMREHFEREEYRKYAIDKFKSEALILSKLRHSHIPRVWDYFIENNRYYLVMDYIEGTTLHKVLHRKPKRRCDEDEVINWAIQICDVLSYLHNCDPPIIYRDIKPANIMITNNNRIMLIDFGIARIFKPKARGTMIGTQGYAPPEQYRGKVDTRSDIYALGATIHHLITGKDPQLDAPFSFPQVKKLRSDITNKFASIIHRCLKFNPDDRYSTVDELKQALEEKVLEEKALQLQSKERKREMSDFAIPDFEITKAEPKRVSVPDPEKTDDISVGLEEFDDNDDDSLIDDDTPIRRGTGGIVQQGIQKRAARTRTGGRKPRVKNVNQLEQLLSDLGGDDDFLSIPASVIPPESSKPAAPVKPKVEDITNLIIREPEIKEAEPVKKPEIKKPEPKKPAAPPSVVEDKSKEFRQSVLAEGFIEIPEPPIQDDGFDSFLDLEGMDIDLEEDDDVYDEESSEDEEFAPLRQEEPPAEPEFRIEWEAEEEPDDSDLFEQGPPSSQSSVDSLPRPTVPFAPLEINLPRKPAKPKSDLPIRPGAVVSRTSGRVPPLKPESKPAEPAYRETPPPAASSPPSSYSEPVSRVVPPAPPPVSSPFEEFPPARKESSFELEAFSGQALLSSLDDYFSPKKADPWADSYSRETPQRTPPKQEIVLDAFSHSSGDISPLSGFHQQVSPSVRESAPSPPAWEAAPSPPAFGSSMQGSPMTPPVPPVPSAPPVSGAHPAMEYRTKPDQRASLFPSSAPPITPESRMQTEPPFAPPAPPERVMPAPQESVQRQPASSGFSQPASRGKRVSEWNMYRGGPRHSAKNENAPACQGQLKWRFRTNGRIYSSPVIGADGTIYIGSDDGCIYALTQDGKEKWRHITDGSIHATPLVVDGMGIYCGSEDKHLYALDMNGSLLWKFKTGDYVYSSVCMGPDGTLYVGSQDNNLYAVHPDGREKWRFTTKGRINSSPAMSPLGMIYFGSWDRHIYALDTNGKLKWKHKTDGAVDCSPAVDGAGYIYFGSEDTFLYALEPMGSLKWKFKSRDPITSSPALDKEGSIYMGSQDNYLYCLSFDGAVKWRAKTGHLIRSSPSIDGQGNVYVGSDDFSLYAFSPTGTNLWKFKTIGAIESSPCITDSGMLLFGSNDGWICALV